MNHTIAFEAPDFGACRFCGGVLLMVAIRDRQGGKNLSCACLKCDIVKSERGGVK